MDGAMTSMMGVGLLGWVLVIGLLAAILIVLVKLLKRSGSGERTESGRTDRGPGAIHR